MSTIDALRKNLHIVVLVLGVIALITAQFADLTRSRVLFSVIALGPVVASLITIVRYSWSDGSVKSVGKVVAECAWVSTSFGFGFLMMLPASYYAVPGGVSVVLTVVAIAMVLAGIQSLMVVARSGLSLTP